MRERRRRRANKSITAFVILVMSAAQRISYAPSGATYLVDSYHEPRRSKMNTKITNVWKVLAASAVLMTAIASPSLAQSDWQGARSGAYRHHYNGPAAQDSEGYWEHRQEWDH